MYPTATDLYLLCPCIKFSPEAVSDQIFDIYGPSTSIRVARVVFQAKFDHDPNSW